MNTTVGSTKKRGARFVPAQTNVLDWRMRPLGCRLAALRDFFPSGRYSGLNPHFSMVKRQTQQHVSVRLESLTYEKRSTMRSLFCCRFGLILAGCLSISANGEEKPKGDLTQGVLPKGADGKPLNLDFETGTLQDWTSTGEAFVDQPVKGDTVFARRQDMKSEHAGEFWIGTFERKGDAPQGTLTSAPFLVTHRYAAFLIGGGPTDD